MTNIFRSIKSRAPNQRATMMSDLGIGMVFAQTGQAKGRIGRYNSTVQLRMPVDAVRFGISSYGQFNDFSAPCLNAKSSFRPRDPHGDTARIRPRKQPEPARRKPPPSRAAPRTSS